jgi:hypothetical protein
VRYKGCGSAKKDFRRKVAAGLAAKRAVNGNRLKRKVFCAGRHIPPAALAGDHEELSS